MKTKWMLLGLLLILVFPATSSGSPITADLVYSNVLPDGILYGRVTVDSLASDKVQFTVDMFTPPLVNGGANFGIHKFGFNTDPDFQIDSNHQLVFTGPSGWSFDEDKRMSEFGNFNIRYDGGGNDSVDPLIFTLQYRTRYKIHEHTYSDWAYQSISPENFYDENCKDFHFAVHVIDIDTGLFEESRCGGDKPITSAYFADGEIQTPIPEPGTMMLLGSGLVGLAGWGRKKFRM